MGKGKVQLTTRVVKPAMVTVEMTSACNLACPMCPHSIMERPKEHMDISLFKRIVDLSKNLSPSRGFTILGNR